MNGLKIFAAACFMAAVLFGCGKELTQTSQRGGSGTETVGIVGNIVDSSNHAVAGASVKLRRSDYLDTSIAPLQKTALLLADAVTNDTGWFFIGSVDTGAYTIEVNDGRHNAALLSCTVSRRDSLFVLPKSVIRPTGAIHGKIPPLPQTDSMKFSVYIYGLDRANVTNDSGNFTISDVPEGSYSLKIIPHVPIYTYCEITGINVSAGRDRELGQISVPQLAVTIHPVDSLAVRNILDSNGLTSVSVAQVVKLGAWPFRVTGLFLNYKKLSVLSSAIGNLTELCELELQNNNLVALPKEIGGLAHLKKIIVSNNKLTAIPPEIGNLDSLEQLIADNNELSAIPPEIGKINSLQVLDVGYNQLSMVPDEITYCHSLYGLLLQHNVIDSLPQNIWTLEKLDLLDLEFNSISTLPAQIVNMKSSHRFINVNSNNLCDSISSDVAQWLNTYSVEPSWQGSQQCRY
jgi:Leucine-rich repeat (LRR) protein